MHPALLTLIERFRAAQDRGVAFVADVLGPTLGVRLPGSDREWVKICGQTGLCFVQWVNGVEVYSHGYGIELTFPDLNIDWDWGEHGEPDGFDVWRLHWFARSNAGRRPYPSYAVVSDWMKAALAAGELYRPGEYGLYYSPNHRTKPRTATEVDAGDSPIILVR